MKVGDTAYIVESNRYVREVEIRRCSGGMFLVRFTDSGGGIQVKAHRPFRIAFGDGRDTFKTIHASSMPISGVIDMGVNSNMQYAKKTDFLSDNIDVKKTLWYFIFDKNRNYLKANLLKNRDAKPRV